MSAHAPSDPPALVRPAPGVFATRLDSAQAFPRHSHDVYGIGRLRRGAQRSWSAAGTVEAGPGDLILVNPGELHDGAPLGDGGRCWHMLYIDPALVDAVARELRPDGRDAAFWRPVSRDPMLAAGFETWHGRLCGGPSADGGALAGEEAQVALLATLLVRHGGVAPPRAVAPPIARARERLDDDPAHDPGLARLAADAGLSRFQLLRAFARDLGLTPHAYLVQRRLALARGLIDRGAALADAAAQAGFADQSHMTRVFRRVFGFTPSAYARARGGR